MATGPQTRASTLQNPGYEAFILAVSVLSLVNLLLVLPFSPLAQDQRDVVLIVDSCLLVIFLADFAFRLWAADDRRRYFLHDGGWLDLLGSMPLLRVFRLFRIVRVGRLFRAEGFGTLGRWLLRERAQSALYVVVFLVVLVLETTSVLVLPLEAGAPNANIETAGDALWWGIVTITTVGYGDQYPVTAGGRIVGVFLLVTGVGLFATFTGFLANAFLAPRGEAAEAPSDASGTVLELRRLLGEQERLTGELRGRLTALEGELAAPSVAEKG